MNSIMLPENWISVTLGDITEIVGGGTPSRNHPEYFQGSIPWVTPTDITKSDSLWIDKTKELITKEGLNHSSAVLVPPGSILMVCIGSIGLVAINQHEVCTNQNIYSIICKDTFSYNEYLAYYLKAIKKQISSLSGETTLKIVSKSALAKIPIPLPPLPEQRRIAAILREADEIRILRQQANEKSKQLYKNLFHDYFYSDQKDANETEFIKLKELLAVPLSSGFSPVSKDVPPGIAVFSLSAITDFGLDETQIKYYPVKSYRGRGDDLEVDDILITRSNTLEFVGKVARYLGKPYPVIYPDLVIRIRLKNRNDSPYLENFLRSNMMISTIRKFARGTSGSMKKISQGDINDFDIYLPSTEKRYAYAELVKMIDKQIELQATALTEINTLYQSLLAQAFSGELTASWRASHFTELAKATEERDLLLKGLPGTVKAPILQQPDETPAINREELTKELTGLQIALLKLIDGQRDNYFTATRVHGDIGLHMDEQGIYLEASDREGRYILFASLDCSLDTIRRELHFLARMGLVKELTLPVEEESGVGIVHYITAYRSLREDDDYQEEDHKQLKALVEKALA